MVDKPWEEGAIKIRKAQVPCSLFISTQKTGFYLLSKLAAPYAPQNYRRRYLVKTPCNKSTYCKPISVAEQNEHATLDSYSEFLRKNIHASKPFEKENKLLTVPSLKLPVLNKLCNCSKC
jgi:hypothetical protein